MNSNVKLITALTGLGIVFAFTGKAQFATVPTSTTNIYNTNTGNVGIGTGSTTAATEKLQVKGGNILLDNWASTPGTNGTGNLYFGGITNAISPQNGMRMSFASAGFIDAKTSTATTGLIFRVDNVNGGTERMRINANGNVGIGTTTPLAPLNVIGTSTVAPTATLTAGGAFSVGGIGTNLALQMGVNTTGSTYSWMQSRNQSVASTYYDLRINPLGGNVGVGVTNSPTYKFVAQTAASNDGLQVIQTGTTAAGLHLDNTGASGRNWGLFSTGTGNTEGAGHFTIFDYGVGGVGGGGTRFLINGTTGNVGIGTNNATAKLTVNGKTLIGNPGLAGFMGTPGTYLLYVQQGILTEKVKVAVATSADWADYVFDTTYKLKTINELERYVIANKHLPNIPSADEMVKEGNDLGEMDAKLLEKIEELTLYIIEQNKRIEKLEGKNK